MFRQTYIYDLQWVSNYLVMNNKTRTWEVRTEKWKPCDVIHYMALWNNICMSAWDDLRLNSSLILNILWQLYMKASATDSTWSSHSHTLTYTLRLLRSFQINHIIILSLSHSTYIQYYSIPYINLTLKNLTFC